MGLKAIHKDLFGHGHMSFVDYQNVCSLDAFVSDKTEEQVKEVEEAYFKKVGKETTIDRLLFECNHILEGLREYIKSNTNNPIPTQFRMDGENSEEKLEYAKVSAEFIERFICCASKSKKSYSEFVENHKQIIKRFISIGLDFNIITGFMVLNKEYYDDVIVTAELNKMLQDQYDKDYGKVDMEEIEKAAQRRAEIKANN